MSVDTNNLCRLNRAYGLARLGKHRQVISDLYDFKTQRPKRELSNNRGHAFYIVAVSFFKRRNFHLALKCFLGSYNLNKKDWQALMGAANAAEKIRNRSAAITYLEIALKIENKDELLFNLGNAYFDLRKFDLAINSYSKIDINSKFYPLARFNIELALDHIGNTGT